MLLFLTKAAVSGLLVALVSTVAKRYPGWGGLIASLPLVSVLAMIWLYGETRDAERVAALGQRHLLVLPALDAVVPDRPGDAARRARLLARAWPWAAR